MFDANARKPLEGKIHQVTDDIAVKASAEFASKKAHESGMWKAALRAFIHSRASFNWIVEPGLYLLLKFQKMLCAEIMSSEHHGFLTCSRFLTTRDYLFRQLFWQSFIPGLTTLMIQPTAPENR